MDNDYERITTFIKTLIEYSGIKYLSEENFIVEALTFLLLTCGIDLQSKFQLLYYQLQNDYVPWGFSAPKNNDANFVNSVEVFISLIDILMRLDVNRRVLQCHHCRTKCSCEVVATFLLSEIDLFTMQDPVQQVEQQLEAAIEDTPVVENASTPIVLGDLSKCNFINNKAIDTIVDIDISSQAKVVLNDLDNDDKMINNSEEATLSGSYSQAVSKNYDTWKGHNDDGIPIINYDALFGHQTIHDPDLQLDCGV